MQGNKHHINAWYSNKCVHDTVTNKHKRSNHAKAHMFHSLPFQQILTLVTLFSKSFFIFPSRYLFAIGLAYICSCRWIYHQFCAPAPRNVTPWKVPCTTTCTWHTGLSPSSIFLSSFHAHRSWSLISKEQVKADGPNSHAELVHSLSSLLVKSNLAFGPPLTYMLIFSGCTYLISYFKSSFFL